jgi:hypothetical protein
MKASVPSGMFLVLLLAVLPAAGKENQLVPKLANDSLHET